MKREKLSLQQLGRPSLDVFKKQEKFPLVVVADNIRSAMNIGSIFRTCDAFAVEKLILCGISAMPPHREITKTAIGATESVDWEYVEDIHGCLKQYRSLGYQLVAIEQTSDAINLEDFRVDKSKKYVLILGNEVGGVSDDLVTMADYCIQVRQYGTKHSLNVSVCAGVVLWSFVRS